jgi:tetratricopeptide (TPR) repeat protein
MAIKGSLREASLPDVLQLLALGQKAGRLSLSDRNSLGYVYFDKGRITYASIVNRRDRLGDILLNKGKITKEQLDAAINRQGLERDKRLGQHLVEAGAISQADLEGFVRIQVEEAVFHLFTWTRGSFHFEAGVEPEEQDVRVSINPESVLLEGARRVDEWSLIEKKIPSFDVVFSVDQGRLKASGVELSQEQQRILQLIDGERDVAQIVEDSGLVEFDVGKALYGLITAGFARRVRKSDMRARLVVDAQIAEHRNLGVAFYKTGMTEEAAREFRRVVELMDTDATSHFFLGLLTGKQGEWNTAIGEFKRCLELEGPKPTALHNLALSLEQLGRLKDAEAAYGEAATRARHDRRVLTSWGVVALKQRNFEVAGGRLDRAREVSQGEVLPEVWYWAQSLVLVKRENFAEAETVLRTGVEHYPQSATLRNNLAVVLEVMGQVDEAEDTLRGAATEGLVIPQIFKNMGDLHYRTGRYDDAWEAYDRAIKLDPELGDDVYFKLGNIAYRRMDHAKASDMWRMTLQLNPDHQLARTNLDTMNALT